MSMNSEERTNVLISALPYMKRYSGSTVVIKYDGDAMTDNTAIENVMKDLVLLQLVGVKVVLVHGGESEVDNLMKSMGKPTKYVDGIRILDDEDIEIVQMVLSGKITKSLVNKIETNGGKAIGLSGVDGGLIEARKIDDCSGNEGSIEKINIDIIEDLLSKGYIPVVSAIGKDKEGNALHLNSYKLSTSISGALRAQRYIVLSNLPGIMNDDNQKSIFQHLTLVESVELKEKKQLDEKSTIVLNSCLDALSRKVEKAIVLDGRKEHALISELFTDEGAGTMIMRGPNG